jgi:hypothetical protein
MPFRVRVCVHIHLSSRRLCTETTGYRRSDDISLAHGISYAREADLESKVPRVPAICRCRGREDVEISRAENESIKSLCDERDTWRLRQLLYDGGGLLSSPSALLLEWMAHIRMSFEDVCDTSPRMWNTLNFMVLVLVLVYRVRDGDTARGLSPRDGVSFQSQHPRRAGRSAVMPGVASGWLWTSAGGW